MIRGFDPGDEGSVMMLRLITSHQNDNLLCSENIKCRFNTNVSSFSLIGNNGYFVMRFCLTENSQIL